MDIEPRSGSRPVAHGYGVALAALSLGLFVCTATMVAAYVAFGVWPAVAVAVLGGVVMHVLSSWAGPALFEDGDVRF